MIIDCFSLPVPFKIVVVICDRPNGIIIELEYKSIVPASWLLYKNIPISFPNALKRGVIIVQIIIEAVIAVLIWWFVFEFDKSEISGISAVEIDPIIVPAMVISGITIPVAIPNSAIAIFF